MSLFFGNTASSSLRLPPGLGINPATVDVNLVFDGNSLTAGIINAGIDQYYPKQVQATFLNTFKSLEFNSFGVGGQTTLQMLGDVNTQIYPLANPSKTNILIAWEDVNSIQNTGRTALENYNDFATYFQGAKSAGFEHCILLTTYYCRTEASGIYSKAALNDNPSLLVEQEAFFEMVKNSTGHPWDYHIDLRDAPEIGGASGQVKNAKFNDYVHLQAGGYDIVAQQVIDLINQIFGI